MPDRRIISTSMKIVRNRTFTQQPYGKHSRSQRLKNGVSQGSVLALLLFNICINDLSATIARKFACADDLAIMHSASNRQALDGTLTQVMATLFSYFQKWKLKLNTTKMMFPLLQKRTGGACLKSLSEDKSYLSMPN